MQKISTMEENKQIDNNGDILKEIESVKKDKKLLDNELDRDKIIFAVNIKNYIDKDNIMSIIQRQKIEEKHQIWKNKSLIYKIFHLREKC